MSKLLIESIFDVVTVRVDLDTWFVTLPDSRICFHIESCGVNGALKPTGAIGRSSDVQNKISLPVITFSAMNPEENPDVVCHEIPQVLLQAILMFQRNPTLETHTGFTLRIQGTKLQLEFSHNLSSLRSQSKSRQTTNWRPYTSPLRGL